MWKPRSLKARFSSAGWGLASILDRTISTSCITFLEKVGQKQQFEQEVPSEKMIRILWTSKEKDQTEVLISREELRSEFPDVYEVFVSRGQIPLNADEPVLDQLSTGLVNVEVYIRCSNKSVAFRNPSNVILFDRYLNHTRNSFAPNSDPILVELRTNIDQKRVEIEVGEIAEQNKELFQVLKPFLHPLQISQYE